MLGVTPGYEKSVGRRDLFSFYRGLRRLDAPREAYSEVQHLPTVFGANPRL